jgi:hypothetical protein
MDGESLCGDTEAPVLFVNIVAVISNISRGFDQRDLICACFIKDSLWSTSGVIYIVTFGS